MLTSNLLILGKDINGNVTFTRPVSSTTYRAAISANIAYPLIVPPNVNAVFFSYNSGANVWVDFSVTASNPSVGWQQTSSELNPMSLFVTSGDTLSFLSANDALVGATFYYLKG